MLRSPLDKYAATLSVAVIVGCLFAAGYFCGVVRTRHEARETREKLCQQRVDAMAKARGYSVVRMSFPCQEAR